MDSIKDLMQKKANDLDVDEKRDKIALAQEVVSRHFPEGARVTKIFDDKTILILVTSSALASEVRLQSQKLLDQINASIKDGDVKRLTTKVA